MAKQRYQGRGAGQGIPRRIVCTLPQRRRRGRYIGTGPCIRQYDPISLGICKPAVAAGPGAPYPFDIEPGHPGISNVMVRLGSMNPAVMMPEIGRSLVHV